MIRAFIGLDLPEDIRALVAMQQYLLPLPRRVEPELFHLTLAFLGEVEEQQLQIAHEYFSEIWAESFPLTLQGFGLFGGDQPRLAYVGLAPSEPLMRLQAKVAQASRRAGIEPAHNRFVPHISLGRFSPPGFAETAALERAVASSSFQAGPWNVREMVLWQSHLGPKGTRYDPLSLYPLS